MGRLDGRTAIVTGGARGLGAVFARALAREVGGDGILREHHRAGADEERERA